MGFWEAAIAIRVQLGTMPTMLGDIVVRLLSESAEIELVGRVGPDEDALAATARTHPDLLVVHEADRGAVAALLDHPTLNILCIAADGHNGTVVSMAHDRVALDRASVARIASAIIAADVAGHA